MFYFQQGLTRIQIGRSVIKLIERSQDKTIDAGKSPELGPDRGQEYGERMGSIMRDMCRSFCFKLGAGLLIDSWRLGA